MAKTATGASEKPAKSITETKKVTTKKVTKTTTKKKAKSGNRRRDGIDAREASTARSSKSKGLTDDLSSAGEEAAARFLDRNGCVVLDRDWTCWAGKADIVAIDGNTLVFVEVKTRRDDSGGFPRETDVMRKREKFEKISIAYLQDHDYSDMPVRFDTITVIVLEPDRAYLRHHLGAYSSSCI